MTGKGYRVTDRRRVDERGQPRTPKDPPGLSIVQFREIDRPLRASFAYVRAHVERLPGRARMWPRSRKVRDVAGGFLLTTEQLYSSTIVLVADRRSQQAVVAAGVVARAIVESVGNLMAILQDPEPAIEAFARDDFRNFHARVQYNVARWGLEPVRELRKLRAYGRDLGLSEQETANPETLRWWPTPDRLLKRSDPPRLAGERRRVFEELHSFWYSSLSAMAHSRMTALQLAMFTEQSEDAATFNLAKSETAAIAILGFLCVISEIELFFQLDPCVHLRAAWAYASRMNRLGGAVFAARYQVQMGMPALPSSSLSAAVKR
jgi:hypothetical protein